MNSKIVVFFGCFLTIMINFEVLSTQNVTSTIEERMISYNPMDGGWLEERNSVRILHLNGSPYEMGYQQGYLLSEDIKKHFRAELAYFESFGFTYQQILEKWNISKHYLPPSYIDELQGLADGSNLSFSDIAVLNSIPLIFNQIENGCCGFSAWGPATSNGNLYHMRSFDWFIDIKDPKTEINIQDFSVLIVRKPDNGYGSLYPELPGWACTWNGINEKCISIGEMTCFTNNVTNSGISAAFRIRMVLDNADTIEDAISILNSNKTCGWNFIISDGKIPVGYVVEQTANLTYIGTWNDWPESESPFWEIEHVVRRTNFFIYPELAYAQRPWYDLRIYFIPALLYPDAKNCNYNLYFRVWFRYKDLSHEIEKNWGNLDLNISMSLTRNVYSKGILMQVLMQWLKGFNRHADLWQWVACPETGDMVVSFAKENTPAHANTIHYFNIYQLLEAEPP